MIIKGRGRLKTIDKSMSAVPRDAEIVVGLTDAAEMREELARAGFDARLVLGERILPRVVGSTTRFNAEGRFDVHRDKPMETYYQQVEWTREQWNGPWTETVTDIVDIPRKRYPRTFIPPPGDEIALAHDQAGKIAVVSDPLLHSAENDDKLLHRVNVFGELFGQAEILTGDLSPYLRTSFRRLNWEVLPEGEHPWPEVERHVRPIIDRMAPGVGAVAEYRLRVLTEQHHPVLTAIGRAGFSGYLIFGYRARGLHVLESLEYGNATYVFDDGWEELSQLSKAEIIRGDLAVDRVVHRSGWERRIANLLR